MKKKFIPQNQDKFIWTIEFPAQDVVHGYQTKNIEYSNFGELNWKKNVDNFCQGPKLGSKFVANIPAFESNNHHGKTPVSRII